MAPSLATQRAAASAASSAPPTRKPAARASPAPVVSITSAGSAARSFPSTLNPAAPRLSTSRPGTSPPIAASSPSFAKTSVRIEQLEPFQQLLGPVLGDSGGRSKVDADPAALCLDRAGGLRRGLLYRAAQKRVPREMQPLAACEPTHVEFFGSEERRDPAVGEHRPASVTRHERDDHAVPAVLDRAEQLDAMRRELPSSQLGGRVGAALADEASLGPERSRPGRDVRRLAARADPRLRRPLQVRPAAPARPDDDVQEQVAECAQAHRGIVSGGLVECAHGRRRSQGRPPPLACRRRRDRSFGRDRGREAQAAGQHPLAASPRVRPGRVRRRSLPSRNDRARGG